MKKFLKFSFLLTAFFAIFGSSYRIFLKPYILNYGRVNDVSLYHNVSITDLDLTDTAVFVVFGQSNAVNDGEIGYKVSSDVFMSFDRKLYDYQDPSLGGTGSGGSVWGMVGDKLIEEGEFKSVVFFVAGKGGASIARLSKFPNYDYFISQYINAYSIFGKVDAVLFQQGESDRNKSETYEKNFTKLLENMRSDGVSAPLFIARTSFCYGESSRELIAVQNKLIEMHNLKKGPNTDSLNANDDRLEDNCHFSLSGLDKLSSLWVRYILKGIN